jgi:hypothetical protein
MDICTQPTQSELLLGSICLVTRWQCYTKCKKKEDEYTGEKVTASCKWLKILLNNSFCSERKIFKDAIKF